MYSQPLQSCPTLCDPMDCSPPGSSVQGSSEARMLEWVAISFSRGSSPLRDWTQVSWTAGQILYHLSHKGSPMKWFSSVQFSRSVVLDSLRPHGLQHARLPCPSPTPRIYSNSCPLSQWCHPTISSSTVPFSRLQSFPASGSFQMSQVFTIRWSEYQSFSFSISPFNAYSGLISFRTDWFDLLAIQGTLESSPTP